MAFARLPINTLSGGVGRQAPTKRLISEAENIDNCLVTLEKSVEKRPPVTQVSTNVGSSYLDVQNITPVLNDLSTDNLYFHFLDIDGYNRYCIIINRAGYPFDPVPYKSFTWNNVTINLSDFITVYRIEPTQWVKETVDNSNITSGFNRGIFEYLTYGNKNSATSYNLAGTTVGSIATSPISETFGSIDFDVGLILWNKLVPLDYLTNNYSQDNTEGNPSLWYGAFANNQFIHSGDVINYKRTIPPTTPSPILEDSLDPNDIGSYWINVRDDVRFNINSSTLEEEEEGQSVENFSVVPQTPASEVYNDVRDFNGYRALRMLYDYYDNPRVLTFEKTGANGFSGTLSSGTLNITGVTAVGLQIGMYIRDLEGADRIVTNIVGNTVTVTGGSNFSANTAVTQKTFGWVDWSKDYGYLTSPFSPEDRDNASTYLGFGKVYFARNPYLTFPAGFYRATRYSKNPYYERVRSEGPGSVFDHRRFPVIIYKDFADSGKWKVKHMPLFPRRAGTSLSNKGPTAVERKEKIQSMSVWKNRLWVATDNTIFASRSNSFYNFWVDDVNNVVETDPIDIQASVGAYNKLSYIVPFQNILFALSSGSVQFEVRGGSTDVGISPFNVEFRPTSFYSTSKLNAPMKLANNVFFTNAGKMYMYLSGSSFSDEYSTSMDISNHCRNYLPVNIGATATSSAVNTIFMVNKDDKKQVYLFTFRTNGDKIAQNAFHRWVFSSNDQIVAMQAYEKDFYLLTKRVTNNSNTLKLAPYFMSLETVPVSTPMLDWLYLVPTNQMTISGANTIITVPFRDPDLNYIIKGPAWPSDQRYTATNFSSGITLGTEETTIAIPGTFNTHPVYVGRSYEMNVELSQMVYRSSQDPGTVLEGVLNLKRITTKHFNSGSYDIVIERRGRLDNAVTFYPLDLNSIIDNLGALKVDSVGEHFCKVLSYSEACKIFIKSAYPTPCNISNIEVTGNFRSFNTSIE